MMMNNLMGLLEVISLDMTEGERSAGFPSDLSSNTNKTATIP
jgi:hypothetical protein